MKYLSLFALLISTGFACAQAYITPSLSQALKGAQDEDLLRIRIEFKENVDCYTLNHEFKINQTPVDERPPIVIGKLQEQAELSQAPVVNFIRRQGINNYNNLTQFWIVNLIVVEATPQLIHDLSNLEQIDIIDLEYNQIIPHEEITQENHSSLRSPGGTENGLIAINAPAMWALGYTGRGRLVYDYDTGVWPTHPSFADRFMGLRVPMNEAWYGYFSNTPNGTVNDHGTHVLGTMAGLDTATHDTIGVAFGAYWIANDFVTASVATLPPITDMIGAFEWALNPDGDISTTGDIPDVINNSWRWYDDPDTAYCAGYVVNLMNAIEAAGIANVFSGGNAGPTNTTISSPQRINTSEVNTFSVGSINANVSYPYPLSNFSSLGPKQCPGSGSLLIHPEVVAPGQNIRSAWGTDDYNTISGTSMASPHVSGAILLLKEAFPYLSGEDLLWAIYLTAVDLGAPGEDNTYGMGIIDVYAAFQHLSATHTPVDPNAVGFDLSITKIESGLNGETTCESSITPSVELTNIGDSTISSVELNILINGTSVNTLTWTGTLTPGQQAQLNLDPISLSPGDNEIQIEASLNGVSTEYDYYNNKIFLSINRRGTYGLPFGDGFENGIESNRWFVFNEDGAMTWDTLQTSGLANSNLSLSMQLFNYYPRQSQIDGILGPELNLPSGQITCKFDVAYQKKSSSASLQDTLKVWVSQDCGDSFELVYLNHGDSLESMDTVTSDFAPLYASHWRRDSIDLSQYAGSTVLLKFETVNRMGNNLYLDNVLVYEGSSEPTSVIEKTRPDISIFPNPAENIINIIPRSVNCEGTVSILNNLGEIVKAGINIPRNGTTIEIGDLSKGVYVILLEGREVNSSFKIIKQ